jgi:hypothetical protein
VSSETTQTDAGEDRRRPEHEQSEDSRCTRGPGGMNCQEMMSKMPKGCPCGSMCRPSGGIMLLGMFLLMLLFLVTQVGVILGTVAFFRTF